MPASAPPPPVFPQEAFRAKQPAAASAAPLVPPGLEHFQLGDGIDVYLVERHQLPTVSLDLAFPGGSVNDPADKEGRAALCMNLLDDGTDQPRQGRLRGGASPTSRPASTPGRSRAARACRRTRCTKHLDAHARPVDRHAAARRPAASDHERNVLQQVASVRQSKGAPPSIGRRVSGPVFYGADHPFGNVVTEASTQAVTLDDCKQYVADYVRPRGAQLYVVGDITRAAARGAARPPARRLEGRSQGERRGDAAAAARRQALLRRRARRGAVADLRSATRARCGRRPTTSRPK